MNHYCRGFGFCLVILVFCLRAGAQENNIYYTPTESQRAQPPAPPLPTCAQGAFTLEQINERQKNHGYPEGERTQWFLPNTQGAQPEAVALVLHGNVQKPSRMNAIVRELNQRGVLALRMGLTGHGDDGSERKMVSREVWVRDVLESYCIARAVADTLKKPFIFAGYSLGALVFYDLMNARENMEPLRVDQAVLFSPAIALHFHIYILKLLGFLGELIMPKTIYIFRNLVKTYDDLHRSKFPNQSPPSLIFIDPKDELIPTRGLEQINQKYHLGSWNIIPITNSGSTAKDKAHHWTCEPEGVGQNEWNRMMSALDQFILH